MVDYHTDSANKRRKYDYTEDDVDSMECLPKDGWSLLQPILENDILCAKIPTSNIAFELLAKWFHIIAADQEKLQVFRQWIVASSSEENNATKQPSPSPNQLVPTVKLADIKRDVDDETPTDIVPSSDQKPAGSSSSVSVDANKAPSISIDAIKVPSISIDANKASSISIDASKASSIDFINNDIPITPRSTPQVLLLQQLLQKQQQQIVILQKLQNNGPSEGMAVVPTANTIALTPVSGSAGVVLTVLTKNAQWHLFTESCACTCGFTSPDGVVTKSQRIPGGGEGEMRFVVPPISFPTQDVTKIKMAVHLTMCGAPHAPLVCAESFTYGRERASSVSNSDDDSEDTPDSSVCDDEENDDEDSSRESSHSSSASPKQLMTVRERMLEFVNSTPSKNNARVIVSQAPPNRVVWKNRRLDTPFKIRVEGVACDTTATKLSVLALVVDHKGKLQIDAMENFDEECNPQGIALFHNLRMTKGTWGKEWTITFVVVMKASLAGNNPAVVGVSQPCPVVVKTRKNPQVRHINRPESPIPVSFVESRKPDTTIRKRNRVEDILDTPNTTTSSSSSSSSARSHSEAMTNLLYAAEIKQQEREHRPPAAASAPSSAPNSPPRPAMALPSLQGGFGSPDPNFANLQGLLGYLEEIKIKHHPSLNIMEQPQLKRDGKVLIVKKGKPFRTPFRMQIRTSPQHGANYGQLPDYNPQQYVCVAVLRNDKGEEVALKNSEVLFDARGLATFSGLMVMKGTWGKSVQLTFEARWSGARRIIGGSNWPPLRMLVVAETPAMQLMCYTKDKKPPTAI